MPKSFQMFSVFLFMTTHYPTVCYLSTKLINFFKFFLFGTPL
nr:MAG TPA: hypothetical protein [Caudoviricetes sp.]